MAKLPSPADLAATHAAAFTQSRPWSEAEFTTMLDSRLTFVIGNKHCFAVVRVILDEAELLTIATHPDQQRHGLARCVMQDWQSQAKLRGAQSAFLEVATDNRPAFQLYTGCGFSTCGNRPGYYRRQNGPAVDAVLMRRTLDPTIRP